MIGVNWQEKGLPEDLSLRIALHAGPIYSCINPLNGNSNFIGTHVTKTARIEPVTPPNHVYASQAFVALAITEKVDEFTYDYVGQTPLAKDYGTLPMYHLRESK